MLSAPSTNVSIRHASGFGIGVPGFAKGWRVAFGSQGENSGAPIARIAQNSTKPAPTMPTMLSRSSANDLTTFHSAEP